MNRWQIVLGILLFAAATAVLYVWGLRKSASQSGDLRRILTGKCANRVVKYLTANGVITQREIARQVSGVRAGQFWSKKQVTVQEPKKFARELAQFMLSQQIIEEAGHETYRLRRRG